MQRQEFEVIVRKRLNQCMETLVVKAGEYARGDRLSNFKRAASLEQCTPERALLGMVAKHIIALFDFTDDIEKGLVQPLERWDEKLGDIMAYMILMDALVQERIGDKGAEAKEDRAYWLREVQRATAKLKQSEEDTENERS